MTTRSRQYKPVTGGSPLRSIAGVAVLVVLGLAAAFAAGRVSAPDAPVPGAAAVGVRFVDGVPEGWPATGRGAGDASAAYLTVLGAAATQPTAQVQALLQRMVAGDQQQAVVQSLLPSSAGDANPNISQTLVARVWAREAADPTVLADGVSVTVSAYVCALSGPATSGTQAGQDAGLAGGWYVQTLTVMLVSGQWRIVAVQQAVPAAAPDVRGLTRDGGARDTEALLQVLGPGSWVPWTP